MPANGAKALLPPAVTRAQLQRLLGRSRADVDRLLALGLPHETVGTGRGAEIQVELGPALAWLARHLLEPQSSDPPLAVSRARIAALQAEAVALKLELDRGRLVERAAIQRLIVTYRKAERDAWLSWPLRLAPVLAGELGADAGRTFGALEEAVRNHLLELAEPPMVGEA
jgi:hypothetical protein